MDFKVLWSALITVFLAEIGDKTQLAVFGGTAATKRPLEIFLGASVGLIAATAVGVAAGTLVGAWVPERVLKLAGGVLFILIGVLMLVRPQ